MLELRSFQNADRDWVLGEHRRHYLEVEGFGAEFEIDLIEALDKLAALRGLGHSDYIIAERAGQRVGCVFLSSEADQIGRLRLFFLAKSFRGRGYGRHMLSSALEGAKAAGLIVVRVSTFDRHRSACALYRSVGFQQTGLTPVVAYGVEMNRCDFEMVLGATDPLSRP